MLNYRVWWLGEKDVVLGDYETREQAQQVIDDWVSECEGDNANDTQYYLIERLPEE